MFPPLPLQRKPLIWLSLVISFGVVAASTAYLLQRGEIELASGGAAVLAMLIAISQWLVGQFRESARISWEAVQAYYTEGDSKELRDARENIFDNARGGQDIFCNFYEKWGRLVELGYLPIEIFNGPSGVGISNAALRLEPFLAERRSGNHKYAQSYLDLVRRIHKKGFLIGTSAQDAIPGMLRRLNAD